MQTTPSDGRLELSEPATPDSKKDDHDFVDMFGFADGPMAGRRPAKASKPEGDLPLKEAPCEAEPVIRNRALPE